jgi:hypothetical protein
MVPPLWITGSRATLAVISRVREHAIEYIGLKFAASRRDDPRILEEMRRPFSKQDPISSPASPTA